MKFKDFLRLILACGSTTAVEQKIVLDKIKEELKLVPMENQYEYVKKDFL